MQKNIVISQRKSRLNNKKIVGLFLLCKNKYIITLLQTKYFDQQLYLVCGGFFFLLAFFNYNMFFINDVSKIKQIIFFIINRLPHLRTNSEKLNVR